MKRKKIKKLSTHPHATAVRQCGSRLIHDVDCRNGFVRVTRGKFAKDRVVPMGKKAAEYVAEYLKKVHLPWSQNQKDERALWLSSLQPHGPMKKQAIAVMVRDYKKQAGVTCPGRTHVWRHSCATHLVQNGANLAYVQRLLGHRSLNTTQIYTRVAVPEVAAMVAKGHPRNKSQTAARKAATEPGRMKGAYGKR